jgi:hypothetical protein
MRVGGLMGNRRSLTSLLTILLVAVMCAPAAAQGIEAVCSKIGNAGGENGGLYVMMGGQPVSVTTLKASQLSGGSRTFYYFMKRSDETSRPAAVNILFEMRSTVENARDDVELNNNKSKGCQFRKYRTYEAFHQNGATDNCLRYGFHNGPGLFPTMTTERRQEFAYSSQSGPTFAQLITGKLDFGIFTPKTDSSDPVNKRASRIINYAGFKPEGSCLDFYIDVPNVNSIRIKAVDLLENSNGELTRRSWILRE